ncbi:TetR/AcrR family transcriptional regulator [Streptomyces sp. NPDC060366]|uniref:TetR/AcrR family transcriptional regulator n=1 Tax=Streptomyces sp. NPDC060366 TaxID=3347105 RepID=UPI0036537BE8
MGCDTRTKILDAAEHLALMSLIATRYIPFAERGYRGTSVRAITDLAGATLAAVGYHFGSKAELLAAVARRVTRPITVAQCAGLDKLLARTSDPPSPNRWKHSQGRSSTRCSLAMRAEPGRPG